MDEEVQLLPAAKIAGAQPQVTTEVEEGHLADMISREVVVEVVATVEEAVVVVVNVVVPLAPLASSRKIFHPKFLLDSRAPSSRN